MNHKELNQILKSWNAENGEPLTDKQITELQQRVSKRIHYRNVYYFNPDAKPSVEFTAYSFHSKVDIRGRALRWGITHFLTVEDLSREMQRYKNLVIDQTVKDLIKRALNQNNNQTG